MWTRLVRSNTLRSEDRIEQITERQATDRREIDLHRLRTELWTFANNIYGALKLATRSTTLSAVGAPSAALSYLTPSILPKSDILDPNSGSSGATEIRSDGPTKFGCSFRSSPYASGAFRRPDGGIPSTGRSDLLPRLQYSGVISTLCTARRTSLLTHRCVQLNPMPPSVPTGDRPELERRSRPCVPFFCLA